MNDVRIEATIRARNAHLYYARKKAGLTQVQAAELCGVKQNNWSKYELMHMWPTIDVQKRIGEVFKCDRSELFPEQMRETAGFTMWDFRDIDIMEFQELRGTMPLMIADDNPENDMERSELAQDIREAIDSLNLRDQFIVTHFKDNQSPDSAGMTLGEIGSFLGLSRERVRVLRDKAYMKLRKKLHAHEDDLK